MALTSATGDAHESNNAAPRAVAVAESGTGPLSLSQQRRAAALVGGAAVPGRTPASGGTAPAPETRAAERDVRGGAGAEVLESSRLPRPKGAPADRHVPAQVGLYHHATDSPYQTRYRAGNRTTAGRATSVDRCVTGQKPTDPVMRVSADLHHVPRDEDQDPTPTHGQGFSVVPRNITATSRLP
ncbi:hypothetical protein [Streptomyces sp.]|uniref:hypothetical protein n=1 Tax=Streptomyces sp. TaxID=1931 RepID=UPI002F3F003F